jgi:hypothetical protein
MKDHASFTVGGQRGCVETRQGVEQCAGNSLGGILAGFSDIDQQQLAGAEKLGNLKRV